MAIQQVKCFLSVKEMFVFGNCSARAAGLDGIVCGDKLAYGSNSCRRTQPPSPAALASILG